MASLLREQLPQQVIPKVPEELLGAPSRVPWCSFDMAKARGKDRGRDRGRISWRPLEEGRVLKLEEQQEQPNAAGLTWRFAFLWRTQVAPVCQATSKEAVLSVLAGAARTRWRWPGALCGAF